MTLVKRKRGGASMPCPKCQAPSRVLETRKVIVNSWVVVSRDRVCRKNKRHRFTTQETVE